MLLVYVFTSTAHPADRKQCGRSISAIEDTGSAAKMLVLTTASSWTIPHRTTSGQASPNWAKPKTEAGRTLSILW